VILHRHVKRLRLAFFVLDPSAPAAARQAVKHDNRPDLCKNTSISPGTPRWSVRKKQFEFNLRGIDRTGGNCGSQPVFRFAHAPVSSKSALAPKPGARCPRVGKLPSRGGRSSPN